MEINALYEQRAKLIADARAILDKGELTDDDTQTFDRLTAEADKIKASIDRAEKLQRLEANLAESPVLQGMPEERKDAYVEAFFAYARNGSAALDGEIRAALNTGTDSQGGFIVPQEFEAMLVEAILNENIMRQIANVITTGSDRNIPVEADAGSAAWTAEGAAYTESDPVFGNVVLGAHKLATIVRVSEELLQDAIFDLQGYLARNFGKRFGVAEELAFVNGTGTGQPTGAVAGATGILTAASNAAITADELVDLYHDLKRAYRANASWLMNDATIKLVRKLKDTQGQYIWQPGLRAGEPDMLMGRPVFATDGMPTVGSQTVSVLFGDFSYYVIADRANRTFQRLNELYAANGQVGFRMFERVDGNVVLGEAIRKLTHPL